jgi:acetyl esterase/lipase
MLTAGACAPSKTTTQPAVAPTFTDGQETGGDIPLEYAEPTFEVAMTNDIVYAQALSHETWGSESAEAMDLLLDVYEPVRFDDAVMPAIVMIHGGGFNGGSKRTGWISEWAPWFAERGWVVYSIDYRVSGDHGTLPSSYPELPTELTEAQIDQAQALYPACRDAKAAIRRINATADDYSVSTGHIAVIGGSAGSALAVGLGVSDQEDCADEISIDDDPTLSTTNLDQSSEVATVIDHWGGTSILVMLELMDGIDRFDATDASVSIVHGTEDLTVPFSEAETIQAAYTGTGAAYEWHPLEGRGHGAWGATIDGQTLFESAYDFIIETQALQVDEPGAPPG